MFIFHLEGFLRSIYKVKKIEIWLVGLVGQKMIKLILHCFWAIISPHTKFCPHWMKNTDVESFCYWSVLVGRGGRSKNGRSHFKLNLCSFWAIISPHTKFHPNWMKNTEVENFGYLSVLVGRAGRSKNGHSHF